MSDVKHRLPIGILKVADLAIVMFAFGLTTVLIVHVEQRTSLSKFLSMRTKISNFGIFVLALIICHLVFRFCGLYKSRRLSKRGADLVDVLKATTIYIACFVVFSSIFSIRMITIPFLASFWVVSTLVLCISRTALRLVAARVRINGRDLRYILILGANPQAIEFARRISNSRERGYRLLGFVDDGWPATDVPKMSGFRLVTDYAGLSEYLRKNVVDEVAIYLSFGSLHERFSEVVSLCEQHGITMRFNSDIFGLKIARWRAEEFEGDQYIATYTGTSEVWPRTIKRMVDITVGAFALLLCSPVLIFAAITIKLYSPGPVFFSQERIGLNKRRFKIFKFRTMVPHAETLMPQLEAQNEISGPVFKIKRDPRITPIGKLLRRSSIDELPQLINVLKGDMSLVGPRPLPVRDYEGFNEDWQRRRFSVKPGITCLWQVNGRSGISFDQWMLLDLQYMDEWSLWLDLKILAKTVPAVMKGSGAA